MSKLTSYSAQKRECLLCGEKKWVSGTLKVCSDCIEQNFSEAKEVLAEAHKQIREQFSLPYPAPKSKGKETVTCNLCSNECSLAPNEKSFCGLRKNVRGALQSKVTTQRGVLHTYKDPIPTNCCANWFCPGGTGRGYPEFANTPNTEHGYHNLAVFFYGCNFDCFFCQNINHKRLSDRSVTRDSEVVERVLRNKKYSCVCYFGGSPEPHFPFVLNLNRQILEKKEKDRILRICFEWNGAGNPNLVKKAAQQALESGGIVKFDLKAPDSKMSYALSGVKNERVFSNFQLVYENFWEERPIVPVLTATTLLVPGYIGPEEIERISKRIASIDERIPYSLLVFHPDFKALDLPITPKEVAKSSLKRAKKHLKHVHLGNKHLLSLAPSK